MLAALPAALPAAAGTASPGAPTGEFAPGRPGTFGRLLEHHRGEPKAGTRSTKEAPAESAVATDPAKDTSAPADPVARFADLGLPPQAPTDTPPEVKPDFAPDQAGVAPSAPHTASAIEAPLPPPPALPDAAGDAAKPAAPKTAATASLPLWPASGADDKPAARRPQAGDGATRVEGAGPRDAPVTASTAITAPAAESFAALFAERRIPAQDRSAPPADAPPLAPAAGTAGLAAPPAPAVHEAAPVATASVAIAPPLDSPEFPHQLGLHVSLLARDGVQRAELRLNPAEMGPVSVQIALDGTQARVDFGADLAATRDVLQHSLPALAAALREAGLTLAGGGVSAHGGERQRESGTPGDDAAPGGREREAGPRRTGATAPRRWVRSGGVDLYA